MSPEERRLVELFEEIAATSEGETRDHNQRAASIARRIAGEG